MRNSIQLRGFARKTMAFEHSRIHDGRGYDCDVEFTLTGTASTYYHFETGQYNIHIKDLELTTDKNEVKAFLFIDTTVAKSTSPTEVTIFNSDHTSNNICSAKLYSNSSVSAEGTKRKVYYIAGTDQVGQSSAGQARMADDWEFITKKNEDYLIKIERLVTDGNTTAVMRLKLYEETAGE